MCSALNFWPSSAVRVLGLGAAQWAKRNNSWLVVTFDENAGGRTHPIYTVIVGEGIRPGRYAERMNHYTLLRTIEKAYGLSPLGRAAKTRPLSRIWKT
jgi:phosphatidylinositol-3-phosphatase